MVTGKKTGVLEREQLLLCTANSLLTYKHGKQPQICVNALSQSNKLAATSLVRFVQVGIFYSQVRLLQTNCPTSQLPILKRCFSMLKTEHVTVDTSSAGLSG